MTLNGIFWLLSVALTALSYGIHPSLSPWWAVPLIVGVYLAVGGLYVLLLLVISLFLPKKEEPRHREWCRRIVVLTAEWVLTLLCFDIRVEGAEKLPADRPCLLVCNHRSNFDPIVTLAALRQQKLVFVSKPENFRIPLVGPLIRCASFLAIDRENARRAAVTIHRAAEHITARGLSVGIYPEGTRSKTGELLEFRAGAFKIAKLANCPIAVMTIRDHGRRWLLAPRRVELTVLDVLTTDYVRDNRTAAISDDVRKQMETALS